MKQDHLTEKMLQEFVDNKLTSDKAEIQKHLDKCDKCTEQMLVYQQIKNVLSIKSEDNFAYGFEDKIMAELNERAEKSVRIMNIIFVSAASIFLCGLICLILFIPDINKIFIQSISLSWDELTSMVNRFVEQNESIMGSIKIFLSALMIIFVFAFPNWRKIISARRET